ncbi:MAG TPA: HAD family hydrolase [Gaiellaceae bacterium]|nr:HAD family hydrolase [Gaiellaceae bacterium]
MAVSLDTLAAAWQRAFDAAQGAVDATGISLNGGLVHERAETMALLEAIAYDMHAQCPWLSPVPVTPELLGLPHGTRTCLIDLDGVLTDSGALHSAAWAEVFDGLLLEAGEQLGWFIPFDRGREYREYVAGRPRIEAIHAFLSSRGIQIDENAAEDLARRKGEAVSRHLHSHGVRAQPGAHRFLDAAGRAGITCGVVSASASTDEILRSAHLDGLVDFVTAAPAELVAADPAAVVIADARAAGIHVVGVGADRVVPDLPALLDPRLR